VLARAWSASLPARRAAAGLAGAGGAVLGQALVDWIWLVPGVMGLGLLCLALAVVCVTPRAETGVIRRGTLRRAGRGAAAAGLGALALLVAALYVAGCTSRGSRSTAPGRRLARPRSASSATPAPPTRSHHGR
jgi:hypothetical protein